MAFFDPADDERAVRASPAEQRQVVAPSGDDLIATNELTDAVGPHTRRKGAGEQRDDVPFRSVEVAAVRVDAQDASPDACGSLLAFRPALLAATERPRAKRAAGGTQQDQPQDQR